MNKSIKSAQGGFTLIELIVVIVILGILAATALPRFTNLSGDARVASLNAARGALSATAAMTHGRHLVNPTEIQNVEGANVTMSMATGYPTVLAATPAGSTIDASVAGLMQAAGLAQDYVAYTAGGANRPAFTAGTINIVPRNIDGTATAANCFLTYTPAAAANTVPRIELGANVNAASCQ